MRIPNPDDYKYAVIDAMVVEHPIITICGSVRFKDIIDKVAGELTRAGWVVFAPNPIDKSDAPLTPMEKSRLDEIHRTKMKLSRAIYVVNADGYIGESTAGEIAYAKSHGLSVYYMEVQK